VETVIAVAVIVVIIVAVIMVVEVVEIGSFFNKKNTCKKTSVLIFNIKK
jgi:hypothetical protein